MKRGHKIPKDKRDAMAIRANAIADSARTMTLAYSIIEAEFSVSTPTARNLVSYGRFLAQRTQRPIEGNSNGQET